MIRMNLNGLPINTNEADDDGALWYVTEWDGWDSPEMRQSTIEPDLHDGTIITQSRWGARVVTLTGVCKAGTEERFWIAYNKIQTVATPFADVVLMVEEMDTEKRLNVRLSSGVKIKVRGGASFDWGMTLVAQNPHKY